MGSLQLAHCVSSIQSGSKLGHKAQETVRVRQAALETGETFGKLQGGPTGTFSHGMLYHASILCDDQTISKTTGLTTKCNNLMQSM